MVRAGAERTEAGDAYVTAYEFLHDGELERGIVLAEEVTRLREVIIADLEAARVGVSYP